MKETSSSSARRFLWGMTLREATLLSLLGAAIAFYKGTFRLGLDLPEHSGIVWMALIVLGKLSVPHAASGTLVAGIWPRSTRFYLAVALEGAVAHLTKLAAGCVAGVILGVPRGFLILGLGASAVTHALFGGAGACLGLSVFNRLCRLALLHRRPGATPPAVSPPAAPPATDPPPPNSP